MTKTIGTAILCAILMPGLMAAATTPAPLFNVRDTGAVGDGKHKDTAGIQASIDACAKAGGGTVLLPAGRYLTGALELRSHVTFELGPGAVLAGSDDPADYPLRDNAWGGTRRALSSLIYAADTEGVTITGRGTIDGQGMAWWKRQWLAAPRRGCRRPPRRPTSKRSRSWRMDGRS